jgi:RNase P/RNase MRP subunit p30
MIDIVIPNGNEEEFVTIAEKLGFKGLCFLYDANDYLAKRKIENKKSKIKIYKGVLTNPKNIGKIKTNLKDNNTFIAIKSSNNDRDVIEKSGAGIIFSLEDDLRRDFIHQRASGLNHIMCKLAKQNNVIIGFSIKSILNFEKKHVVLGRIAQNIKICRKFKTKILVASFAEKPFEMRSVHDIISLFGFLGLKGNIFLKEKDMK